MDTTNEGVVLLGAIAVAGCVPQSVTPNPERYWPGLGTRTRAKVKQYIGNDRTYVYEACKRKNGQAPWHGGQTADGNCSIGNANRTPIERMPAHNNAREKFNLVAVVATTAPVEFQRRVACAFSFCWSRRPYFVAVNPRSTAARNSPESAAIR